MLPLRYWGNSLWIARYDTGIQSSSIWLLKKRKKCDICQRKKKRNSKLIFIFIFLHFREIHCTCIKINPNYYIHYIFPQKSIKSFKLFGNWDCAKFRITIINFSTSSSKVRIVWTLPTVLMGGSSSSLGQQSGSLNTNERGGKAWG